MQSIYQHSEGRLDFKIENITYFIAFKISSFEANFF